MEKNGALNANFSVNAFDVEKNLLKYIWMYNNGSVIFATRNESTPYLVTNLIDGQPFSFRVIAEDDDGNISNSSSSIFSYKSKEYSKLIIPSKQYYDGVAIFLTSFLFIFLLLVGLLNYRWQPTLANYIYEESYKSTYFAKLISFYNMYCTRWRRYIFYLAILLISYAYLFFKGYSDNQFFVDNLGYPLFFNSLQFFEIFIFVFTFIVVGYFNGCCYLGSTKISARLWLFNSLFMAAFVLS